MTDRLRSIARGMALASTALSSPALARDGTWCLDVFGNYTMEADPGTVEVPDYDFRPPDYGHTSFKLKAHT